MSKFSGMGRRESASASTEKDHQCSQLAIDIPDDLEPILWLDKCCIYKVPGNLRKLNEEAYTPQLIAIGPLHHDNKKLANMEQQKSIYLKEFCKRTNVTWKHFMSILEKDEERIRQCYAEKSILCSNEYVKMILLDAVFIIELFLRDLKKKEKEEKEKEKEKEEKKEENEKEKKEEYQDDYMLEKQWLKNGIQQDLLLLENQLPYFVLNNLYKLAFHDNHKLTFHDLSVRYFLNHNPQGLFVTDHKGILHFTDLLRYFMSHTHPNRNQKLVHQKEFKNLHSAAKLHEAGLKFKGIGKKCLTDIQFEKGKLICCKEGKLICCKKGKLIMPQFEVYDTTECVIRNLMALEQCHYPDEAYICNYIILMDHLINTDKDVDLLVEKEVIVNGLGSNEAVAEMVNKLGINIIESNSCYVDIWENLNEHYKKRHHRAMKTLRSVYFANIWRGTSTVAAIILLVLTLLATISSFLALHDH